jgi:serine/threonine protein kinase
MPAETVPNLQRWQQVEQLFSSALKQKPDRRAAFLSDVCKGDEDLRRAVEALLAQASEAPNASACQDTATVLAGSPNVSAGSQLTAGQRLGPYRIEAILGAGGMGQVYTAVDTRLGRKVAIKVSAEQFSGRFEREARAISALNHPHICTLHDVGPNYLVMELVEGETLRDWLKRARPVERSVEVARQVLGALRAAHQAGVIHRDLKPANIMVRIDGYVKVLDFGLAKRVLVSGMVPSEVPGTDLSLPGQILGTIAYMSPEQIQGKETDPRSDLFAFGIILHEMLTSEHPWPRKSTVDTLHAILHDDPPPIRTAALAGLATVVQKLLRKNPADRYPSAEAILDALASLASSRTTKLSEDHQAAHPPHAPTRLIVLPFRLLRRNEASDFLAVSLPDAIASSLAAIDSLVVRSTMTASRFASAELDVNAIAEQAQVDAILTGTILSDGEHLRMSNQLIEAPSGTVLWSNSSQVSLGDIFQLQDELVDRIVQSLTLPLTARERLALKHDVPASAMAYEYYLRANQLAAAAAAGDNMSLARDLYLRCVELDPKYAPAWACLGRAHRFIGKFVEVKANNLALAEAAFRNAFALNPDLALAHNFYTSLQTDLGQSVDAMERLLKRAHAHRNDPNLFTGLVQACRYCDLLEASVAAHNHARQLDPNVRTSVAFTYLHLGDFRKALEHCNPIDAHVIVPMLAALGREQEAIEQTRELQESCPKLLLPWRAMWRAYLEGDCGKSLEALDQALGSIPKDPEGLFCAACLLARLNQTERALELLSVAVDQGYRCHYALSCHPWLDSLRSHPRFKELANRAEVLALQARTVFLDNEGDRLLGGMVDN